ncbi:uncharacterized protein [Antedon mediterranea]
MTSSKENDQIPVTVNPFYAFLTEQHDGMKDEEFKKVKLYSRDKLAKDVYDELSTPLELFEKLWDNGIISEDDTRFLEEVYERMKNKTGLGEIEEYKPKIKEYKERIRLLSVKHDSLFVGRDKELHKILQAFAAKTGKCCCVILAGSPGIGKTKLSIQTCAIYSAYLKEEFVVTTYLVNLRNLMSLSEVGAAIMNAIGIKDMVPSNFNAAELFCWIRENKLETIIYLDNADDVLKPRIPPRDDFINFLREFVAEKNQRVKFLITSRYRVDNESLLSVNSFHQLEIKPLEVLDAMSLLRRSSELRKLDDAICKDLVLACGQNPHAIRTVASRMKLGHMQPKELLELLKNPTPAQKVFEHRYGKTDNHGIEQTESVLSCLHVMFNQLDNNCKSYLVKLAVFPSFFYREVAAIILDEEKSTTSLHLEELCAYGVLQFDKLDQFKNIASCEGECNQYIVHTLVRQTCNFAIGEDPCLKTCIDTAKAAFFQHYHQKLNRICELANRNFKEGFERFQSDKSNLIEYLKQEANISPRNTVAEFDFSEEERQYAIWDGLVEADRRVEYFEKKSKLAKKERDYTSYSFFCAWLGDQHICQAELPMAVDAANDGLKTIDKLKSEDTGHKNTMIAKAACLYVKGRAYSGQRKYLKSLNALKRSLALRRKHERDHTMTARGLNSIGHLQHRRGKYHEARSYHQQALDIIERITDNYPEGHIDYSVYVMNMGACLRSWGNRLKGAEKTAKYDEALEWFKKAWKIQKNSFPGIEISHRSKILKNMALCNFEKGDYIKALPDAEKSLGICRRILKENPDTARCLYFVGRVHHHIGKKILRAAEISEAQRADAENRFSLSMEFLEEAYNMEHSLGADRRSLDYESLKEEIIDVLNSLGKYNIRRWKQRFKDTDNQEKTNVQSESSGFSRYLPQSCCIA